MSHGATRALILRPLDHGDVERVEEIQERCFARPLPRAALRRELLRNRLASYVVADLAEEDQPRRIVGYAGLWRMVDEAHVSAVAVAPAWRRRGIGRRLMTRLLDDSRAAGMRVVTLEVRFGNLAARAMYAELGFREVGRRLGYYPDNGEDAVIMTTRRLMVP